LSSLRAYNLFPVSLCALFASLVVSFSEALSRGSIHTRSREEGLAKAGSTKDHRPIQPGLGHGARSQNVIRTITCPACARLRTAALPRASSFVVRTMHFSRTTRGWDL